MKHKNPLGNPTTNPEEPYLDHNVLDQMTKGDPKGIRNIFEDGKFIAAYSTENLNEIRRSKHYEDTFLEVLRDIKAMHIVPDQDSNFRYLGTARVVEGDPAEIFHSYIEQFYLENMCTYLSLGCKT